MLEQYARSSLEVNKKSEDEFECPVTKELSSITNCESYYKGEGCKFCKSCLAYINKKKENKK